EYSMCGQAANPRVLDGALSAEVLEGPANDRQGSQEHADAGQPPAQGKTQEDNRAGGSHRQRPPAVRAEEPVLSLGGRDQSRRIVLRPRVQLATGLP